MLSAAEELELVGLLDRQENVEPLADFIARITPRYPPPAHAEPLRRVFEQARRQPVHVCVSLPPRHDKAIDVETPMLTRRGWARAGDIQVGDELIGEDGDWTRVLGVYPQGEVDLFAVTFSDGTALRTCADHQWKVRDRYGNGAARSGDRWQVLTTAHLRERGLFEADGRTRFRIPVVKAWRGHDTTLPLDPYLLGAWLGDGHSRDALITSADPEIVEAFRAAGLAANQTRHQNSGRAITHRIERLYPLLRRLGVLHKKGNRKHVPDAYLRAPAPQRIALLQGLCDTDGTVNKDGSIQAFCTTSEPLVTAFRFLIASLGGTYTEYRRPAAKKIARIIRFQLPGDIQAFRLRRKLDRLAVRSSRNAPRRFFRSIEPSGRGEAVCFEVESPDHVYAAGPDLVVTHNTMTIQPGLAWLLSDSPGSKNAYISYGAERAEKVSRGIQMLSRQAGVRLATEAVSNWMTTSGGGLVAVGIGGPYTGEGTTGIQVVDDPYKNAEEAESPLIRNKVWDWFESVARTRAEPGCSQLICHTRWHPDDLIGRLMREEPGKWKYVNLPAVADFSEEAFESYRRGDGPIEAIGRALWPEFWPLEELVPLMRNKHFWWALYMGSPRLRGARLFDTEPGRFDLGRFNIHGFRAAIGVDPAGTKKNRADHTAIVVGAMSGLGDESTLYILDCIRMQEKIPTVVRRLRDLQTRWKLAIVCEAVAGFKAVPQMLLDVDPRLRIKEIAPSQDKFLRAQPLAAAWCDVRPGKGCGRVLVPDNAPWVHEFLSEFDRFTGVDDDEDDQVDATAHLWNALYRPAPERRGQRRVAYLPFG